MRHAILGAGGVGGLIGGTIARAGHPVTLLLRPDAVATHPRELTIRSAVLGDFTAPISCASELTEPVDIVWLTTKAIALPDALDAVIPEQLGSGVIIPLLNGLDHVELLSSRYGPDRVIAGIIRVEAVREAPGVITHGGWHVPPGTEPVQLAPMSARAERIAAELTAAGIPTQVRDDVADMLWGKLSLIATFALVSVEAGSLRAARDNPELTTLTKQAIDQFAAVAAAEGAQIDRERMLAMLDDPPNAKSSLQRDVEAGLPIELDAIAGPAIRAGHRHDLDVSALERLRDLVAAKAPGQA